MVTIEDIAADAQVSVATVSRVLNGNKSVSEKLRRRVLESIQRNHYMSNAVARSLVAGRSDTIAVVVPDMSDYVSSKVIKGISRVCQERNKTLIVCDYDRDNGKAVKLLYKLQERNLDGLIFSGKSFDNDLMDTMLNLPCPVVLFGQADNNGKAPCRISAVIMDGYEMAGNVTRFLLRDGHRKIAYIGGNSNDYMNGVRRKEGFFDAMIERNLSIPDSYIVQTDFTIEAGYIGMKKIYEESEELPTAIIAGGDAIAVGVIRYLQSMGIRIPEDISLISFDDTISDIIEIPLSAVHTDVYQQAQMLLDELERLGVKGKKVQRKVIYYSYKILRRRSTRRI